MIKNILAVVAGLAAAFATVWLVMFFGHSVFPPPAGLDVNDRAQMQAYVESLPVAPLLFVLASYYLGTLLGILVADWLAPGGALRNALIIGALMLAATIANLVMIPHPMWFVAAAVGGIVLITGCFAVKGRRV